MNVLCVQQANQYVAQGLDLSGWQTSVLDVCKHVTTHSLNHNISVNFYQEYFNILLAIISILLYL
jgi:hypothetical protein